jgi:hypothetical protein
MKTLIGVLSLALIAETALSAPIAVPNFSFENPPTNSFAAPATSWTPNGGGGSGGVAYGAGSNGFAAADDGVLYHYLNLTQFGGPNTGFTESDPGLIGAAAAGTYSLTVAAGRRTDNQTTRRPTAPISSNCWPEAQ